MLRAKTNPHLVALIKRLKRAARSHDAAVWRAVAVTLEKPLRVWREVNVGHLDRVLPDGLVAVVPGKVLGGGVITRPITVIAYNFSEGAKAKISEAGGKTLTLEQGLEEFADGTKLQVVG